MKRGVVQHPKFEGLQRAIQEPKRSVVGMLELLWHATEMYHDDGGIGRWSDVNIAGAMDWHGGDARQLISTLIDVGWLDRVDDPARLVVHDWLSHCSHALWFRWACRIEHAGRNVSPWLLHQYLKSLFERPEIPSWQRTGVAQPAEWIILRRLVLSRDGRRCGYCGQTATTVDHVVPRCHGGGDDVTNLISACALCNSRKGGRTPAVAGMPILFGSLLTGGGHHVAH